MEMDTPTALSSFMTSPPGSPPARGCRSLGDVSTRVSVGTERRLEAIQLSHCIPSPWRSAWHRADPQQLMLMNILERERLGKSRQFCEPARACCTTVPGCACTPGAPHCSPSPVPACVSLLWSTSPAIGGGKQNDHQVTHYPRLQLPCTLPRGKQKGVKRFAQGGPGQPHVPSGRPAAETWTTSVTVT